MLFVPAEVVPWWSGLAIVPVVAWWRRWRLTRVLAGVALAAGGVAYYRLMMAHRPAGYYALFEAWAAFGMVLGIAMALAGVARRFRSAHAPDAKPLSRPINRTESEDSRAG